MGSTSTALEIARMVTEFLGPHYPRIPTGAANATLNALRTRLETDTATYDNNRDKLAWDVREAIRTEFFKIIYPTPPTHMLLTLVTRSELLLTNFPPKARPLFFPNRPFYFPGARVAVPTEAGSRRAGTTLQLRFKEVNNAVVTESLLHLDGPNGGGFQWVQTQALTPLVQYQTPIPTPIRRPVKLPVMPSRAIAPRGRQRSTVRTTARPPRTRTTSRTTTRAAASQSRKRPAPAPKPAPPPASEPAKTAPTPPPEPKKAPPPPPPPPPPKPVKVEPPKPPSPPKGPAMLPPTYVPEALLSTSPPPRKRLRGDLDVGVTHFSGTLRRTLDVGEVENLGGDRALEVSVDRVKRLIGVERIVARRKVKGGGVEYFVVWSGRSMKEGSWERKEALMIDVPGLVVEFDTKHPNEPRVVCCSDRVKTEVEEVAEERKKADAGKDGGEGSVDEKAGDVDDNRPQVSQTNGMDVGNVAKLDEKNGDDATAHDSTRKYIDDVSGVEIPAYIDTPILELSFSGMVLQVRRPNECMLHSDVASAARDYKRRQARFKQEDLIAAEKVFPLSKTEAKSALEASLRVHRAYNRFPMPFPRGIGQVAPSDCGVPFTPEMVAAAPPSWEAYLHSVGLRPKHFERNLPPFMPDLDTGGTKKLAAGGHDLAYERAVEHRERARSVVRAQYRHTIGAPPPLALFRDEIRRPGDCEDCYGEKKKSGKGTSRSCNDGGVMQDTRVGGRDPIVAKALAAAKQVDVKSGQGWYDAVWSCWRAGPSPTG